MQFRFCKTARDCINRYKDAKLFGYEVEVTWFRDIRRYIAYCQKKGIRPRPARANPRYRRGRFSRSRSRSRSKSKSRSRSYSYSDRSVSRSRSRSPPSRSSRKSSASPPPNDNRFSPHSEEESKRSPSPPRRKKPKKDKKKKKRRSPSHSPSNSASDMELSESEAQANGIAAENEKKSSKKESELANNNSMNRISFSIDVDSAKSSSESDYKGKFIPVANEVAEQKPIKQENNGGEADHITNKSKKAMSPSLDSDAGSALSNFKKIQKTILQEVRYKPPEVPDSPPTGGTLRLRTIQKKSPETIREEKLARLSKELREKVERKKLQLELAYRQDCETFGFVAQNLIQKDRTIEEKIRLALLESMKEIENGTLKQLDEYIDQLLFVTQ
uniref:Periphilin-1 C-terminal domain-containing protein n=1 Tax=Acrobeloides nanus TaxID=290746 RepID=A0A914DUT6_9BILA